MKRIYQYFIIILFSIFLFPNLVYADDKELNITMINSNQLYGDAVLLESKGEYLLMDSNNPVGVNAVHPVVKFLQDNNITSISIYLSHYHADHYGGLRNLLLDNGITINKVYLPKTEYFCKYYNIDENESSDNQYFYKHYTNLINYRLDVIKEQNIPVEFLWPSNEQYSNHCFDLEENSYSNQIQLGDATIEIIGPVGNYDLDDFGTDSDTIKYKGNKYINNYSLVAMIKVGNIKFFSAGDISEYEESNLLKSGVDISADIMKLSHHGNQGSNSNEFIKTVNPKYAFATTATSKYHNPENISLFSFLVHGESDCTTNCFSGTNLYLENYSGTTTFSIKNDVISVISEKNYNTININYIDKESNEIIMSRKLDFPTDATYHIYDYIININGYVYDSSDEIVDNELLKEDKIYNVYYNKKSEANDIVEDVNENDVDVIEDSTNNYVDVVDIPNTFMSKPIIIICIGLLIIAIGLLIVLNIKKKKH